MDNQEFEARVRAIIAKVGQERREWLASQPQMDLLSGSVDFSRNYVDRLARELGIPTPDDGSVAAFEGGPLSQ